MGPPRTPPANSWGQAGCTSPLRTPLWDPNPSAETPQLYPNVPPPHHSRLGDPPGDRPNPPTPPGGHSRSRGCSRAARRPCADPSGGSPTRPRAASPPPSPHLWDGKCIRPPLTPPAPTGPPPPLTHVVLAGDVAQDGVALGQFDVAVDEVGELGGGEGGAWGHRVGGGARQGKGMWGWGGRLGMGGAKELGGGGGTKAWGGQKDVGGALRHRGGMAGQRDWGFGGEHLGMGGTKRCGGGIWAWGGHSSAKGLGGWGGQ